MAATLRTAASGADTATAALANLAHTTTNCTGTIWTYEQRGYATADDQKNVRFLTLSSNSRERRRAGVRAPPPPVSESASRTCNGSHSSNKRRHCSRNVWTAWTLLRGTAAALHFLWSLNRACPSGGGQKG
eukprot:scaffold305685_cov39-Tisochrysis_lutea.AAC.2